VSTATPPEIAFFSTFLQTDEDVHLLLLQESHRKHGVWLTVPPQRPPVIPNVGDPAIPDTIFPARLKARLQQLEQIAAAEQESRGRSGVHRQQQGGQLHTGAGLAYTPMHGPPPLNTTGTRSLYISDDSYSTSSPRSGLLPASGAAAPPPSSSSSRSVSAETRVATVAKRSPADPSMRFHCTQCGRAFRREAAAKEHVVQRHLTAWSDRPSLAPPPSTTAIAALMGKGPGPGEVIGFEDVVQSATSTPSTTTPFATAAAAAAVTEEEERASPQTTTATIIAPPVASSSPPPPPSSVAAYSTVSSISSRVQLKNALPYDTTPTVALPEESLIDELLQSVWDVVAMAREDIAKPANLPTKAAADTTAAAAASGSPLFHSGGGAYFIPSSFFFEGNADNRAELEAAMTMKPLARATPEGAAPGIKRRPSTTQRQRFSVQLRSGDGTPEGMLFPSGAANMEGAAMGGRGAAAPSLRTAAEMSIRELARHYPNPFGDSPSAAVTDVEKESINPFRDLESIAASLKPEEKEEEAMLLPRQQPSEPAEHSAVVEQQARADLTALLQTWVLQPFSCPLCRQMALQAIDDALLETAAVSAAAMEREVTAAAKGLQRQQQQQNQVIATAAVGKEGIKSPGEAAPSPAAALLRSGDVVEELLTGAAASAAMAVAQRLRSYNDAVPRFRLMDGLEEHLSRSCPHVTARGADEAAAAADSDDEMAELSEMHWQLLYQISTNPALWAAAEARAVHALYSREDTAGDASRCTPASGTAAATNATTGTWGVPLDAGAHPRDVGGDGKNGGTAAIAESVADGAVAAATAASLPTLGGDDGDCPPLHLRTATNIILLGTVSDIQEGYSGSLYILQYVLRVTTPPLSSSSSSSPTTASSASSQTGTPPLQQQRSSRAKTSDDVPVSETVSRVEKKEVDGMEEKEEEEEVEYVVVRCCGDSVPTAPLRSQVRPGTVLFVSGLLRLNRCVDMVSHRSHAYPFVQVVPPLGTINVVA